MTKKSAYFFGWFIAAGAADRAATQEAGLQWYGGFTVVSLYTDAERVSADRTLSADFFAQREQKNGRWFFYLEGNSSLDPNGVSISYPEANADAATAIDPDGGGRIQLSEANYRFSQASGSGLTVGLVDPTAYLDRSRITNDENVQFLATPFVNNPTIAFPDYTLGLVYDRARDGKIPQFNAVLTSANGLAANSSLSYSQLAQLNDDDDGAFGAIAFGWPLERHLIRSGVWVNTKPFSLLADSSGTAEEDNYGAYFVYGYSGDAHGLNVRAGIANEAVSRDAKFLALAYRYRWRQHALGAGVSRTFFSHELQSSSVGDATQFEVFGRFTIGNKIHLTASVQRLLNSASVVPRTDLRRSATIVGLRFHYQY